MCEGLEEEARAYSRNKKSVGTEWVPSWGWQAWR